MPKLKPIEMNPDEALRELAQLQARRARLAAEADEKIARIKEQAAKDLEPTEIEIKALENKLSNWIKQNPQEFTTERSRKTAFGSYGLRLSKSVKVADENALKEFFYQCLAAGKAVADIGKLDFKPIKEGIKNRLVADQAVPGCELREKDGPFYEVDQDFLDRLIKGN